eukprot:gene3903-4872_t
MAFKPCRYWPVAIKLQRCPSIHVGDGEALIFRSPAKCRAPLYFSGIVLIGRPDSPVVAHWPFTKIKAKRSCRRFDVHIGVPLETQTGETRVAATPETIKKLIGQGHKVTVQSGAGINASVVDSAYEAAGATIGNASDAFGAELILKVVAPNDSELTLIKSGAVLVGMLNPFSNETITRLAEHGITAFALEAAPRTSRAQSLDVLSSQANIAGYKAVLLAAHHYPRFMPMLMTAAGTVKAARVLILGAGVAGLQAIATAKRLGAVIEASDVRPAVKEQIESLGAKFVDVPYETDEE